MIEDIPTSDEMESLFVNNEKLERIQNYLGRFNPIRIMKMERMEIRHSTILAWLLDPTGSHGLSDRFLKAFLGEALRGHGTACHPTALEISQSDMRDAEVRCEWQNIDIFLLSPLNNWAFVVENKFDSTQREGQLAGYVEKVKSAFRLHSSPPHIRGIFLTLEDEAPQDANYAPIKYGAISEILLRLMGTGTQRPSEEVEVFLKHYLEIIRDATGMSQERNEMEALARELYQDHKKVLDFVLEHGASSDFATAARTLFGEATKQSDTLEIAGRKFVFNELNNKTASFLPKEWHDVLKNRAGGWPGCQTWWAGCPLIVWFQVWGSDKPPGGQLRLYAEVGPLSDYPLRKDLIARIKKAAASEGLGRIAFQNGADEEGRRFSKFLKGNSFKLDDIQNADAIVDRMRSAIKDFQTEFDAVTEALPGILEEARNGKSD